jgi:hypothetical protein
MPCGHLSLFASPPEPVSNRGGRSVERQPSLEAGVEFLAAGRQRKAIENRSSFVMIAVFTRVAAICNSTPPVQRAWVPAAAARPRKKSTAVRSACELGAQGRLTNCFVRRIGQFVKCRHPSSCRAPGH